MRCPSGAIARFVVYVGVEDIIYTRTPSAKSLRWDDEIVVRITSEKTSEDW